MYWVKFKNNYNFEFDLISLNIGRRQKAEEQIDQYEIPYRNDDLIIHSGTYKPYIREMEFALMYEKIMSNRYEIPYKHFVLSPIHQWLSGRGQLRTEADEDGYFIASVISGLEYEAFSKNVDSFKVSFKVNPFFYLDSGSTKKIFNSPRLLINTGNIYSEPYIKIVGNGNIDLIINSDTYSFTDIDGYIEVDSEMKMIYKDTLNQGEKMSGNFPILNTGNNSIMWTGNVSSIEIIPRWREL